MLDVTVPTDLMPVVYRMDCREGLERLPEGSVHCVVTSPPYWGLRDYGLGPDQLGLERTPEEYVERLVGIFREVRRVLRDDGVMFLNLDDSYAGNGGGSQGKTGQRADRTFTARVPDKFGRNLKPKDLIGIPWRVAFALQADGWYWRSCIPWLKGNAMPESTTDRPTSAIEYWLFLTKSGDTQFWTHPTKLGTWERPAPDHRWTHKSLAPVNGPDGKPKPPPVVDYPPVSDRLLGRFWKRANLWRGHDYWYDAEAVKVPAVARNYHDYTGTGYRAPGQPPHKGNRKQDGHGRRYAGFNERWDKAEMVGSVMPGRNRRNADWFFDSLRAILDGQSGTFLHDEGGLPLAVFCNSQPFRDAHFATFAEALVRPIILAGCPERVCPVCGKPWVRVVERTRKYDHVTTAAGKSKFGPYAAQTGSGAGTHDIRHGVLVRSKTLGFRPHLLLRPRLLAPWCRP